MFTNKSKQPHLWDRWRKSGAIQEHLELYVHPYKTNPPPSKEVSYVILLVTNMLTKLIDQVKIRGYYFEKKEHQNLIKEVISARYQLNNCEYHIAKECFKRVLPNDTYKAKSYIRRRMLKIIKRLDWLMSNDTRPGHTWIGNT